MITLGIFLSYLLLYKYVALFIIVFAAGVILPLPVNTLLMAVGAFCSQGYFDFVTSFAVGSIANILGDVLDYFLIRSFGHTFLREEYIKKYSFFLRLENYLVRHVGLVVFISRIIGILGPPVNFLSGYLKISFLQFIFFDGIGNAVYVSLFLLIGLTVGSEWQNISGLVSVVSGIVIVLVSLGVIAIIYGKKKYE